MGQAGRRAYGGGSKWFVLVLFLNGFTFICIVVCQRQGFTRRCQAPICIVGLFGVLARHDPVLQQSVSSSSSWTCYQGRGEVRRRREDSMIEHGEGKALVAA